MGVVLGSDVCGSTAKDRGNLPTAERFFQSQAAGQFVSVSDEQRRVNGRPLSVSGRLVRKTSAKEGEIWHYTIYVK